jgi:TPR repeat protein
VSDSFIIIDLIVAPNRGAADAQLALGYHLRDSGDVAGDQRASVDWFRKAAAQGNVTAQHEFGIAYRYGIGVSENVTTAGGVLQRRPSKVLQPPCMRSEDFMRVATASGL